MLIVLFIYSTPYSTGLCLQHLPFPLRQGEAMALRWVCPFTSFLLSSVLLPVRAVEKWDIRMRFSPKTHHVFLERHGARRCLSALSYHLTSVGRREPLTVVVFPVAEHADLWKQSLQTQNWSHYARCAYWTRSCRTAVRFGALYLSSLSEIYAVWGSPARAYEDWEWKQSHSQRGVKDPEPSLSAPW